ncbi:hypothetical protein AB8U03_05615 [Clostridium sp. Mt-5]|uniref:Uncharacterized protein n=1 Tax=Clostridium moutaii TaxID=3240932 RepID=A0ABV4BMG5_9CLOT
MKCENLQGCPIYTGKIKIDNKFVYKYKREYCEKDKYKCARYMVKTKAGKSFVPSDLLPDMIDRAKKIIAENTL